MFGNYFLLATNLVSSFPFPTLPTLALSVRSYVGATLDNIGTPSFASLAPQNSTSTTASQVTKAKQPTISATLLNGKAGMTSTAGSGRGLVTSPFLDATYNTSFFVANVGRTVSNTGFAVSCGFVKPNATISFYLAKNQANDQLYFDSLSQIVDVTGSGLFQMLTKSGYNIQGFNWNGTIATLFSGYISWNTRRTGNMNVDGVAFLGSRDNQSFVWPGDLFDHDVSKSLTRGEIMAYIDNLNSVHNIYEPADQVYRNVNFIFDGNSICYGFNSSIRTYPAAVAQLLKSGRFWNEGDPGKVTTFLNTAAATRTDLDFDPTAGKNILIFNEGINDLKFGATGAQAYQNIKTYCQNRKIANPGLRILVCGLTARSDVGNVPQYEVNRLSVNNSIATALSAGETWIDGFARVDLNADLNSLSATFYSADGVHPNNAGCLIWANIVFNALLPILA